MPWRNSPADRANQAATYGAQFRAAREIARSRVPPGYCEQCRHTHPRTQADHITPVSQGGGHDPANLAMLCAGPGSCRCHELKTAAEGGGYRSPSADPEPKPRTRW